MESSSFTKPADLPVVLYSLYDSLYGKIEGIVGGTVVDLKSDPTTLRVLIEATMSLVEKFENADGTGWSGPEKKRHALTFIKFIIQDLATNGKIDNAVASDIVNNLDFWGGIVMDVAVDAAKKTFDIGQEFAYDVRTTGCASACKQNCVIV